MPVVTDKAVSQRKVAKQRRSKAKLELIMDTTLKLLSEGPADRITTNEIARRAGISVGSLYQYFPKKEAIYYELFRRWLARTLEVLDSVDADFNGSEDLRDCVDAIFERLSGEGDLNAPGHWQLRRAMGGSKELAALEAQHLDQILQRLIRLQEKFGRTIPADLAHPLAYLQNQVSIACLNVAANASDGAERDRILGWCRKTLYLVYDFDSLSAA
ncbi:TetR/AcrR family transcriptional regulator [Nisaea acidiphila]|uniref:TetR/AcrR family transcriptional regulator n=1 Tax=Nisaea acidiphila TaxID=1862145 RepID=A0A9J7AQS6_9PROT|nr:TetR/AcrR family transcriptional regulator [Nisaea acidiphila]UUX49526.1 TetR/AcrR family transcriptional regulator [Nisaea acidiphila]